MQFESHQSSNPVVPANAGTQAPQPSSPSWPGLSRPSTSSSLNSCNGDVDARHKAGHDNGEAAEHGSRVSPRSGRGSCGTTARLLTRAALLALLLGAATGFAHAEDVKVSIDNFTFNPQQLKVKAGTTVTWTNHDDIPHVVAGPPSFKSKALDSDDSYAFTFTTPGTYKYFCSLHPHMTGTIVVEAASSSR